MAVRSRLAWGAVLGAGAAYETYTLVKELPDDTLSACTRATFRTDTAAGRVMFTAAWCGFAAWFLVHIRRTPR
jgi:hypothetical protein